MRAAPFVVFEIVLEDPTQPGLMENNDVVQALPSNGPDQALNVGVLPRALRCGQNFVNAQPIRRLAEFLAVRTVAVAQQVTRAVVPREGFQELAGRPFGCRVRGYRKMDGTSSLMVENYEDEWELERNRWDDEEIRRKPSPWRDCRERLATTAKVASCSGPCTWRPWLATPEYRVSGVRHGCAELPSEGWQGSFFG